MILTHSTFLNPTEKLAIFKLWNQEYPKSLNYATMEEFDYYLAGLENLHHVLVKDEQNCILGWYIDFKRENEVWFAMILDASIHKKRIGSSLIEKAKKSNKTLNGWVIDRAEYLKSDGSIYKSPLGFYLKNDFKIFKKARLESPNISAVKIIWMAE